MKKGIGADEVIALLRSVGCNGKLAYNHKRHQSVVWWSHNGERREQLLSGGGSGNWRGVKNVLADVRRQLIDDGDLTRRQFTPEEEREAAAADRRNKNDRARIVAKMQQQRAEVERIKVEYHENMELLRVLQKKAQSLHAG